MKVFLLGATLFVAVCGLVEHEQWASFKQKHVKVYNNIVEEKLRFQIFSENLKKIADHNERYQKGDVTYTLGINKFSDLSPKEFSEMLRRQLPSKPQHTEPFKKFSDDVVVPDSIDWREKGAVTPVRDQDIDCGSGWAFSTLGTVEGQNAIINNDITVLSEQELIDCGRDYGVLGCNGAWPTDAINYITDNGVQSDESYKYEGHNNICRRTDNTSVVKTTGYIRVEQDEEALKVAVGTVGPISICVDGDNMQNYDKGIYYSNGCSLRREWLDHVLLVVGYGTENGTDYWIVKNSWGTGWGEDGYIRIQKRGNVCGMLLEMVYPTL